MAKEIKLLDYAISNNLPKDTICVGVDEAGRGALSGPVTIAACIMPYGFQHPLVKDSKLLSDSKRQEARRIVLDNTLGYAIVHISSEDIDNTNILKATMRGMYDALIDVQKDVKFDLILVDGNQFHGFPGIDHVKIIGGDNKYTCIAAASIIAKTERDSLMKKLNEEVPGYLWNSNKGYGTRAHISAICELGPTKHHRQTFISHMLTKTDTLF